LVHARWLKFNDRLLVRLEDGPGADIANNQSGKGTIEIDGQGYNLRTYPFISTPLHPLSLTMSDDALTEPSVDTTSGSWEDEEEKDHFGHNEHDPFTTASVFEAETRKVQDELETIKKQVTLAYSLIFLQLTLL
jgi:hypothetical protein